MLVNAGSSANIPRTSGPSPPAQSDFSSEIRLTSDNSFTGSTNAGGFCGSPARYELYVTGRFSKRYKQSRTWQDDSISHASKAVKGTRTGVWLDFGNARVVTLKIGISYVSETSARNNLDEEIPGWDFEAVHARAHQAWSALLDRVAIKGGTPDQRKIFYTGLYHSFLAPTLFSDRDARYIGFDHKIHSLAASKQRAQYTNFSDWDTYRNTVQLQTLFEPEHVGDMMQSLINDAAQSGWLPRWPAANDVTYIMGGDSPVILLASSYAFGARNFDVESAMRAMVKSGTEPGPGPHNGAERPFLADYRSLGYIPIEDDSIAASRTLEYANDDFAIAQFARMTGHASGAKSFLAQSQNWKNLLDPSTHWIRPRNRDGSWLAGFDPELSLPRRTERPDNTDQKGFEEGNTSQYTFMVPFDYPALFAAIGGDNRGEERLDKFFAKLVCWGEPCFNMANEPDFVTPYAYVFAGKPWKTQAVITRIEDETFKARPDGIPGNDDLGATSGVYVWNALGIYPAVPGVGGLVLGTPLFDEATLRLAGGRILKVTREGSGIYVDDVSLNGTSYSSSWLPLSRLREGINQLQFKMSTQPNKQRGSKIADRPPSFQ